MPEMLTLIQLNLFSPMVLAFILGIITIIAKSDLQLPEQIYTAISIYLLLSIGLEGGYDLSKASLDTFIGPAIVAVLIGLCIPYLAYIFLTRFAKLDAANAIAIGVHYGGVSSVMLSAGIAFLGDLGQSFEGFLPTLYVIMELPAFFVALLLVASHVGVKTQSLKQVALNALRSKTFILIGGGVIIGLLSGDAGEELMTPFFFDLFPGILTLFLFQMGTVVASRIDELRKISPIVILYALLAPILHAVLGITLGTLVGLSVGGAFILGVLSAGASFISAPAVVRTNIPSANPGIHMTTALAINFPFNLILGLPIYYEYALWIATIL